MLKQYIAALLFALLASSSLAQDTHFAQFYANPLHLNPALAGGRFNGRLALNFRNQWALADQAFRTLAVSYDQYSNRLHGGWGFRLESDQQMGQTLVSNAISSTYAYRLTVSRNSYLQMGFQAGYAYERLDMSRLVFEDQLDGSQGVVHETAEYRGVLQSGHPLLATGMMWASKRWWAGASASRLPRASGELQLRANDEPQIKTTLHGGMELLPGERSNWRLLPNLLFQQAGKSIKTNVGLYADNKTITVGAWLRSTNALSLLIGWQNKRLKSGYSYDVDFGARAAFGGAHELSLIWELRVPRAKKVPISQRYLLCPEF